MNLFNRILRATLRWPLAIILALASVPAVLAQAAPHQAGTVKSVAADSFVLTTSGGQELTVNVPAAAKILIVPPGAKDLGAATSGSASDVQPGDHALVTGSAGDSGATLHAARVILMKSSALAESHATEEAAWTHGGGGIVKSVDPATGTIVISSGLHNITITTTPATIVKRYSGNSVRFEDAVKSSVAEIHPGDQLRVRGTRSADGSSIAADAIVTGSFRNYSGLLSAVDPAAGTVTLKDLATKKVVTVAVTPNSDVRRLPPTVAQMIAGRMRGGANGAASAGNRGGANAAAENRGGAQRPEGAGEQQGTAAGARRAGMDLSQMLSRLPTETLAGLKTGEAVMIVATSPSSSSEQSSAVTLLTGVEPILTAAPTGEGMMLSPWSVGGGEPDSGGGGMGGEGGGAGSGPGR